ncbi:GNAT family N-acetyltransferase [Oerskovia jenensis]|uniref:GNAT superfamily N-acetyltransferase n=1 Tax=Oerskovia jenensis TaxID=162169 RepID=A0ABS2LH31_9CELL|nr:GNAT family N-acetyltransferase [Oerskovia jenensis]MBM7479738.1 GNAT superfamily N-acetyltransferase [Oerskovia jenensis]
MTSTDTAVGHENPWAASPTPPPAPSTTTWRAVDAPPVPPTLEHPDVWAVRAYTDIEHDVQLATWGWTDWWAPLPVMLGVLQHQEYQRKVLVLALPEPDPATDGATALADDDAADGARRADREQAGGNAPEPQDVGGAAIVWLATDANTHLAYVTLMVRPTLEGRGIGETLLARAEEIARADGRTTVIVPSNHSPEPPPGPGALDAPTGAGRVPAASRGARFALGHGYALEQVERASVLRLPVAPERLDTLEREATRAAGDDYRLHTWWDEVPAAWQDQVAILWTRMSTDVPSADLDVEESPWDAARVRSYLADMAGRHQHVLVTVAEHVPTGTLTAFSVLQIPVSDVLFAFQEDTLVLREHRGHRLGMLVKVANLRAYAERRPGERRINTWNAQENEHMLAINVALGFEPVGVAAVWQKKLT